MTNSITKTLFLFILLGYLMACGNPATVAKETVELFDFGTIQSGHYHNAYLDLDLDFNTTWIVREDQEVALVGEQELTTITEENSELRTTLEASAIKTAYLLAISKHPETAKVAFNPSFVALVESVKAFPDITTGAEYLYHLQQLLEKSPMEYEFEAVSEQQIGEKVFYVLDLKVNHKDMQVQQSYWCTIERGFCLSYILSFTNAKEKEELYAVANTTQLQ